MQDQPTTVDTNESDQSLQRSEHATFLFQAIADIQGTIRAIDSKVNILLVILAIPLSAVPFAVETLLRLSGIGHNVAQWFITSAAIAATVAWLCALAAAWSCLRPITNPVERIRTLRALSNAFYCGNLFQFSLKDIIANRRQVLSSITLEDQVQHLPKSATDFLQVLVFEQMKLAYVRDLKLHRVTWAYIFVFAWLIFVLILLSAAAGWKLGLW